MSLEEEHEALHRRGEMIKFLLLLATMVGTVLLIALLRPLIFERMVPAALGLDQEPPEPPLVVPPTLTPSSTEEEPLSTATATPPAEPGEARDDSNGADGGIEEDGGAENGGVEESGDAPPIPQTYEVQRGDSLVRIAEQFGVSLQALITANDIANPDRIQPGDLLQIPAP